MCKLIGILYAIIRWDRFRDLLIRRHLGDCPRCGQAGVAASGWAGRVRPPDWVSREASLWPEVERLMAGRAAAETAPPPVLRQRPWLKLAVATGGTVAVAVLALLLGRRLPEPDIAAPLLVQAPRIEILSAEIEGLPARASLFQTERASFIWFSRTPR